jgi:hypothetical protein
VESAVRLARLKDRPSCWSETGSWTLAAPAVADSAMVTLWGRFNVIGHRATAFGSSVGAGGDLRSLSCICRVEAQVVGGDVDLA